MDTDILKEQVDVLGVHVQEIQNKVETLIPSDMVHKMMPIRRPTFKSTQEDTMTSHVLADYLRKGDTALVQKGLSSASGEEGGFLVPQAIQSDIQRALSGAYTFRHLARVMSISTDALDVLVEKDGLDAGWVMEKGERPETASTQLSKIKIPVHEVYAKPRATQKLLDDACIDVEEWMTSRIIDKFRKLENEAFLKGDGQLKPRGILTVPVSYEGVEWGKIQGFKTGKLGGFLDEQSADILLDMVASLKSSYLEGAVWIMSRCAHLAVRKLKDAEGQYIWQPGLSENGYSTLLGYPVVILEEMPGLSDEEARTSIIFGNVKEAYTIVDRQDLNVLRDPFSAKPHVEFYATKRVGGDVVNPDALKVLTFGI